MADFRARIGRVRMKSGGADVHVFHNPNAVGEHALTVIERHARDIAGFSEPDSELVGSVVIGMFSNGRTTMGFRCPDTMGRTLATAWLIEAIRRDIVTAAECEDVFDSKFEWIEQ